MILHELTEHLLARHGTDHRHHQHTDDAVHVTRCRFFLELGHDELVEVELAGDAQVVCRALEALAHLFLDARVFQRVEHEADLLTVAHRFVHHRELGEQDVSNLVVEEALNGVAQLLGRVVGQVRQVDLHGLAGVVGSDVRIDALLRDANALAGQHLRDLHD